MRPLQHVRAGCSGLDPTCDIRCHLREPVLRGSTVLLSSSAVYVQSASNAWSHAPLPTPFPIRASCGDRTCSLSSRLPTRTEARHLTASLAWRIGARESASPGSADVRASLALSTPSELRGPSGAQRRRVRLLRPGRTRRASIRHARRRLTTAHRRSRSRLAGRPPCLGPRGLCIEDVRHMASSTRGFRRHLVTGRRRSFRSVVKSPRRPPQAPS